MLRIIYSKKGKIIHVTFKLKNPETAALSGEFKSWSLQKNPMKNLKNGSFLSPSLLRQELVRAGKGLLPETP
jgi:hypothetical protein